MQCYRTFVQKSEVPQYFFAARMLIALLRQASEICSQSKCGETC